MSEKLTRLALANAWINKNWEYKADPPGQDNWASTQEAKFMKTGDCDDVSAKRVGMAWDVLGFSMDEVTMGIVDTGTDYRGDHMVALYWDSPDCNDPYVLDWGDKVVRWSETKYKRLLRAFSRQHAWLVRPMRRELGAASPVRRMAA